MDKYNAILLSMNNASHKMHLLTVTKWKSSIQLWVNIYLNCIILEVPPGLHIQICQSLLWFYHTLYLMSLKNFSYWQVNLNFSLQQNLLAFITTEKHMKYSLHIILIECLQLFLFRSPEQNDRWSITHLLWQANWENAGFYDCNRTGTHTLLQDYSLPVRLFWLQA